MTLRKRALYLLATLGAAYALAASRLPLSPHVPELCIFKRVTGIPCCGCGMTHAFCALAHGQVQQAADFNLASLPLALLLVITTLLLLLEALRNKPHLAPFWNKSKDLLWHATLPIFLLAWLVNLAKLYTG